MKQFRNVIFWLHLATGLAAGLIVLIMSVTGVLLTYEKQMLARADRSVPTPPPTPGAPRLPVDQLVARIEQGGTAGAPPSAITFRSAPAAPASVSLGRGRTVLVNPYTGEVLGDASPRLRAFFRGVTDWHRWLALRDASRATGKAVTGAANLGFLFLVVSGFYLWWPKNWRWQSLKAVTLFTPGLRGKARDWNWHNVIGFWSALPLLVVVASATIISYPWASDLVYRLVGETPPARGPVPGATASAAPGARGGGGSGGGDRPNSPERRERGAGRRGGAAAPATQRSADEPRPTTAPSAPLAGVDAGLAVAQAHAADWQTITLQLPRTPDAPLAFTIDRGSGGQPQKRGTLTVDRATAAVVKWDSFESQSLGRRVRSILRFAHTGEVLGLPGQTVAGLASAGAAVLVYTGFALSWRRFTNRRRRQSEKPTAELAESLA